MNNNNENFNRGLDSYISLARREESRLQPGELLELMQNAGQARANKTMFNSKVIIVLGFALFLITASLYIYNKPGSGNFKNLKTNIAQRTNTTNATPALPKNIQPENETNITSTNTNPDNNEKAPINNIPEKSPKYSNKVTASFLPSLSSSPQPSPAQQVQQSVTDTEKPNYSLINENTHIITLSAAELKKLGITVKGQKVYFTNFPVIYADGYTMVQANTPPQLGTIEKSMVDTVFEIDTFPSPALVTDEQGNNTLSYENDANFDRFLVDDLMKLVPVLVEFGGPLSSGNIKNNRQHPGIICWYMPRDNFLNKLPQSIANQFHCTHPLLENNPANDTQPGCSNTYEACNNTLASACDIHLYPNPVQSAFTLELKVESEKQVHISLYNLSGKEVKTLSNNTALSKGLNTLRFDADGLSKGMYLVEIIADNGEAAYQRLIKQ